MGISLSRSKVAGIFGSSCSGHGGRTGETQQDHDQRVQCRSPLQNPAAMGSSRLAGSAARICVLVAGVARGADSVDGQEVPLGDLLTGKGPPTDSRLLY